MLYFFLGFLKVILFICKDGIVILFEYIKLFFNVLEVRIEVMNVMFFVCYEVVMDFLVFIVSCCI